MLGVKLLRPEEAARNIWVRGEKAVIGAFNRLSAEERGEVVKAGLEALGVWKEGQDGEAQAGK